MKLKDFVRHLHEHGCVLLREGGKYSIWQNPSNQKETPVTRHLEIADFTAKKICKTLGIPAP